MFDNMSDAQRSMLQAAVAREDSFLSPVANARAAAVKAFADKLIDAGWAKEIRARNGALVWRKDKASGDSYALKLSAKGLKAARAMMAAEGGKVALSVSAAAREATPQASPGQGAAPLEAMSSKTDNPHGEAASTPIRAPRPSSKLGLILGMLVEGAGATIDELVGATGWLKHTTRAALTGLRHRGYELSLTRKERDGVSVYRIVAHGEEAAQ